MLKGRFSFLVPVLASVAGMAFVGGLSAWIYKYTIPWQQSVPFLVVVAASSWLVERFSPLAAKYFDASRGSEAGWPLSRPTDAVPPSEPEKASKPFLTMTCREILVPENGFVIFLAVAVLVFLLCNAFGNDKYLLGNGDSTWMVRYVDEGTSFCRWLQGTAILSWFFAIWKSPLVSPVLPEALRSAQTFVRLCGSVLMGGFVVVLASRSRRKLPILFVATSGMWLGLAIGFVKIYPFCAPWLVYSLLWYSEGRFSTASAFLIGLLFAFVGTSYLGMVPVAFIEMLCVLFFDFRLGLRAWFWFVSSFFVLTRFFWNGSIPEFLSKLWGDMNMGDEHTLYGPYIGHSAGKTSISFAWDFLLSPKHLDDTFYIALYSGTLSLLLLLVLLLGIRSVKRVRQGLEVRATFKAFFSDRKRLAAFTFILLMVIQALVYTFRTMPKLGPRSDVGFFFALPLVLAFAIGVLVEKGLSRFAVRTIFFFHWGSAMTAMFFMRIWDIPNI